MKTLLCFIIMFITIQLYSQKVAGLPFWMFAGGYKSNSLNISLPGSYVGTLVYKNNILNTRFSLKNNLIFNDSIKINLKDKDLLSILLNDSVNKLNLRRVSNYSFPQRVLIDTLDFYAFDTNFNFNTKKVRKYQLLFSYRDKLYQIRQNIFRNFKGNFDRTIADIEIKDEELKKVIAKFYDSIENK